MSLVVKVCVNGSPPLELVVARRTSGGTDAEDLNSYDVQRFDVSTTVRQIGDKAEVIHRYGDGAAVLAYKALGAVLEQ